MSADPRKAGDVVTTRYFGGYERVKILRVHDAHFVVSRFGGAWADVLPKDQIEKVLRSASEDHK